MKPTIIAHRGASAEAPENTLSSFRTAISLGVDFVEFDVRLCKDGIPILFHDPTLARITRVRYAPHLHKMQLVHIRKVDAGFHFNESFKGELIPTLEQALNLEWEGTGTMIELKLARELPEKLVKNVFDVMNAVKKLPPKIVMGSFSLDIISLLLEQQKTSRFPFEVIGIIEKVPMIQAFINLGVKHLALWHRIINPLMIKELNERNITVWTFTVDKTKLAKKLISLSVNGIITNNPRSMLANGNFDLH